MLLSVLIPVLPKRYPAFMRLLSELQRQVSYMHLTHPSLGTIEILFDDSPAFLDGGCSIGAKRNKLRMRAGGEYSVFLDDDEVVAPNYIETLVKLCQPRQDVISYRCLYKNDHYWGILNMSLANKVNQEASPEGIIQRGIWHVCPIKTEITRKEHFDDDLNHGEDANWLNKIIPHLQTENHSDLILLQYNHSEKGSEADKIIQAGYR